MIFAILFKTEENFLKLRSKCCMASKTGNPWLAGWGEYLLPARCGTGLSSGSKAHSKLGTSSGEPNSVIFETRLTRRSGPENPFWNLFRIQNFELGSGSNHEGSFNFYFELNYEIPLISVVFLSVLASLCSLSSSLSFSNRTKHFFLLLFSSCCPLGNDPHAEWTEWLDGNLCPTPPSYNSDKKNSKTKMFLLLLLFRNGAPWKVRNDSNICFRKKLCFL